MITILKVKVYSDSDTVLDRTGVLASRLMINMANKIDTVKAISKLITSSVVKLCGAAGGLKFLWHSQVPFCTSINNNSPSTN